MDNNETNKSNNINTSNNEPIILGELKKEKSSKPIFVLVVFSLILGTCFLLPNIKAYMHNNDNSITRFYNTYLKGFIEKDNDVNNNQVIPTSTTTTKKQEETNTKLTCILNNEKYIYNFTNEKLTSIEHSLNYIFAENTDTYLTKYQEYKNITSYYNTLGSISEVYENDKGFVFNNNIDLNKVTPSKMEEYKNENYFDLNSIKGEILKIQKDKGFDCA